MYQVRSPLPGAEKAGKRSPAGDQLRRLRRPPSRPQGGIKPLRQTQRTPNNRPPPFAGLTARLREGSSSAPTVAAPGGDESGRQEEGGAGASPQLGDNPNRIRTFVMTTLDIPR